MHLANSIFVSPCLRMSQCSGIFPFVLLDGENICNKIASLHDFPNARNVQLELSVARELQLSHFLERVSQLVKLDPSQIRPGTLCDFRGIFPTM